MFTVKIFVCRVVSSFAYLKASCIVKMFEYSPLDKKLSTRPFVKYSEFDTIEGEIWRYYIRLEGNEEMLTYLKKIFDDQTVDESIPFHRYFRIEWESIPEYEVDILVKHSDYHRRGLYIGKLDGKFVSKEEFEKHVYSKTFDKFIREFMDNCQHNRKRNREFFGKFDNPVVRTKYLLIQAFNTDFFTGEQEIRRTVMQYNGNEEEIIELLKDWRKSDWFQKEFKHVKVIGVDDIHYDDEIIIGKFGYTEFLKRKLEENREDNIRKILTKGQIQYFIE